MALTSLSSLACLGPPSCGVGATVDGSHTGVAADVPFDRTHQQEDTGAEAGSPLASRDRCSLCPHDPADLDAAKISPPGLSTSTWKSTSRCSARRTVSRRWRACRTRWSREPSMTPRSFTVKAHAVVSASLFRPVSPHSSFHHREVLAVLACALDSEACGGIADGCESNTPHSDAV